jgi:hypothetical protein
MNMKNKLQIIKVRIEHCTDESPDTSYLGEFTDSPDGNAFIREGEHEGKLVSELGEDDELPSKGREYRFFLPSQNIPHNPKNWAHVQGAELAKVIAEHGSIEKADRAYAYQDWQRMERLNNGDWYYIGIIAKAELWNPASKVTQTVRSGGLWGIESDSGADYLASVAKDEFDALKTELLAMGIGERAIARAFKTVETVNK